MSSDEGALRVAHLVGVAVVQAERVVAAGRGRRPQASRSPDEHGRHRRAPRRTLAAEGGTSSLPRRRTRRLGDQVVRVTRVRPVVRLVYRDVDSNVL